jgi:hypothetical protein
MGQPRFHDLHTSYCQANLQLQVKFGRDLIRIAPERVTFSVEAVIRILTGYMPEGSLALDLDKLFVIVYFE